MTTTKTDCPAFVDNRSGNTLARAITSHLSQLHDTGTTPEELCIATGYFNAAGWLKVAAAVEPLQGVRLLLGAEPTPATEMSSIRLPEDPPAEERERQQVHDLLNAHVRSLRIERDRSCEFDFTPETIDRFKRLRAFFRSDHVQVRRYPNRFFHAKAWLFRGQDTIVGSSNLTAAGLSRNLELNLGHHDSEITTQVEAWFDDVWSEAEAYDLAEVYADLFQEWTPYQIYLRVLFELYGEEIEEEDDEGFGRMVLTNFQKHGIWRAKRILKKYGGVIVADGVGLGKTFTAGGLMEEYKDSRQRILLIRPAALADTWNNFLTREHLGDVNCVSYEGLASDRQLATADTRHITSHIHRPIEEYQLVVIDEAHNYRNPDAQTRAAVLRHLLRGPRRDLVMLTATPVNNTLMDLYHLLRYFLKQDSQLSDRNIPSLKGVFDRARRQNPEDLNPDLLYPVIDATTVKRTRSFIKKHYNNDKIPAGKHGAMIRINFPKPIPKTVRYQWGSILPEFMAEFEAALAPPVGKPQLTMARYQPDMYLKVDPRDPDREGSLVGLLRSGLLKRFESSAKALANTCRKMADQHKWFLDGLDAGWVARKDFFKECSGADDFDLEELLEASDHTDDVDDYKVKELCQDVQDDMELLEHFAEQAELVTKDVDPKLEALANTLADIAAEAKRDGVGESDERDKRKVVIFSYYKDTAVWIRDYLEDRLKTDSTLVAYKDRLAATSGSPDETGMMHQEAAVSGFAPRTAAPDSWPTGDDGDLYDILVATDVLAEGVNLQQARHIINYDMPWNPMRMVQRHGRIDRLFSEHKRVFVRTFFPDADVDKLLDLESRVRDKLALAAASVGVEDSPIEEGAQREQAFAETRREIEKIQAEDGEALDQGGTAAAAQTGEEYRADLRKALATPLGAGIPDLPWKAGSGMVRGERSGHFFCAKIGKDRTFLRFVPLDANDHSQIESKMGTCLRLITCDEETARVLPDHSVTRAYEAWQLARTSIWHEWDWQTDPANLQPRIPRVNRDVEQFLTETPPDGVDQHEVQRISDILLSPWHVREQNTLREVWKATFSDKNAKAKALHDAVLETGIEPAEHPEALPPIDQDQISLICWLAIEAHRTEDH